MIPAIKDVKIIYYQWNILNKPKITNEIYKRYDKNLKIVRNELLYFQFPLILLS